MCASARWIQLLDSSCKGNPYIFIIYNPSTSLPKWEGLFNASRNLSHTCVCASAIQADQTIGFLHLGDTHIYIYITNVYTLLLSVQYLVTHISVPGIWDTHEHAGIWDTHQVSRPSYWDENKSWSKGSSWGGSMPTQPCQQAPVHMEQTSGF